LPLIFERYFSPMIRRFFSAVTLLRRCRHDVDTFTILPDFDAAAEVRLRHMSPLSPLFQR